MRNILSLRPLFGASSSGSFAAIRLVPPAVAALVFLTASCGGGGSQNNPETPDVVIAVVEQFLDVGDRYELSGSQTTDPNGEFEDIEFQWRLVDGDEAVDFDDHCRNDFDEICTSNDDDHCTNDTTRFCDEQVDCLGFGTCDFNSGTTSPDCSTGICGIGEGDNNVNATFVAGVAGPFTVRLVAIGSKSNGTSTKIVDTNPSLYVVGTLVQFGGTKGVNLGAVADAAEYAAGATQGVADPITGNLVVVDKSLELIRTFELRTGEIVGPFGESDRFVNLPTTLTFNPDDGRLYVAEESGRVLIFDGTSGLLISTFASIIGVDPLDIHFSPINGDLLVVDGVPGGGVRTYAINGALKGVLGNTAAAVDEAVSIDFLGDDLLIADATGSVVRCSGTGTNCGAFSNALNGMLDAGSPSAIAVNPSADDTDADVMIADPVGGRVITCNSNGNNCATFGDTGELDSDFLDVFFAPVSAPTTTTTVTTTTTTTLN